MKQVADQLKDGRALAVAALIAVAALLLAGCGGSSDATGQGTESASSGGATKALLIKRGDAICHRTDELQQYGLAKFERTHPGWSRTPAGVEAVVLKVALPLVKSEILQLTGLKVPEGEKAKISEFIKAMDDAVRTVESNPGSVAKFEGPFRVPGEMAAAYGFQDCKKPL